MCKVAVWVVGAGLREAVRLVLCVSEGKERVVGACLVCERDRESGV